jgi:signal peptidase I
MSSIANTDTKPKKRKIPYDLLAFLVPVIILIVLRAFFIGNFFIPSASMEPTMMTGDRVFSLKINTPEKGQIVVFNDVNNWMGNGPENYLTKRVIAMGGDTVECCNDKGQVLVNGEPLDESAYLQGQNTLNFNKMTVPEGYVFVMGDNRQNSADSRFHIETNTQFIPETAIIGKPFFKYWPIEHFGIIPNNP